MAFRAFYFDYSLGVLLAAVVAALHLRFHGGRALVSGQPIDRQQDQHGLRAWAPGVIFNLANMLLVAAISIAGMAVAFPVGIGLALVVGVIWNYFLNPQGNPDSAGSGRHPGRGRDRGGCAGLSGARRCQAAA